MRPVEPGAVATFSEALRVWLRIGLLSFGGPAGQIALMHRILIEEKRWISETRFLHALNYCMLLPGPEAQQLATYAGWLLHGVKGGLAAGIAFVLPGALVMMALSFGYVWYADLAVVSAAFIGIKAAVLIVVIEALMRLRKRVLKNRIMLLIAFAAFVGIFFLRLPFPVIVLGAATVGFLGARWYPRMFDVLAGHESPVAARRTVTGRAPRCSRLVLIASSGLILWFAPVVVCGWLFGPDHVLVAEGLFFSKMAVVTFGGAYAVLGYVAQQAVETYHWLAPGEMIDGLGLAESTPGPLIMVVQFVGFLGAYRQPGALDPALAAVLASLLTVWVTFVPCFLWIFLGAPYVERLQHHVALNGALSAVTAAVVGVIANLAIWFGLHVVFATVESRSGWLARVLVPDFSSVSWLAALLVFAAAVAMFRFRVGMIPCLFGCAALAVGVSMLG